MSKFTELFPGGGGKPRILIYRRIVMASAVLTLPAGYYDVIAIGAGGSGAVVLGSSSAARATGGGGPSWARDWGSLSAPTDVTVAIGARALGVTRNTPGATNGNTGGTTTVTGILNPITLTGGGGGVAVESATNISGGLGGVATGGVIRANGGRGGDIVSTNTYRLATGGGAVDLLMTGSTRGGDITFTTGYADTATGGGGVGGRGGDASSVAVPTAGGGAGGDAADNAISPSGIALSGESGDGITPSDGRVLEALLNFPALAPIGSGTYGASNVAAPSGGGSGGSIGNTGAASFGATGGMAYVSGGTSGSARRGGGSGGVVSADYNVGTSGDAGAAIVIISVYKDAA